MRTAALLSILLFSVLSVRAQDTFYDMDSVQTIEIYFAATNWDALLDANVASETYLVADQVIINGTGYSGAGVKYKGNSSYSPTRAKNPMHIKLDYSVNQDYQGYQDIKLGNGFSDPTMIREVSSYAVLRNYMDGPRCNYAKVYINGAYWGLYTNSEDIGNNFVEKHYYSSCGTFVKCNPQNAGPGTAGSSLLYISPDSSQYYNNYEIQSDFGWRDLVNFCDTLNNHPSAVNSVLDVDRVLWMLAFNNVMVNLDSYSGAFRQNYYLYRNHQQQWIPTVWDLNMSYGGFVMTGQTQLTLTGMQTMSPDLHLTDANWPLISKLLANPVYKRMYYAHMRTLNNENFLNQDYKVLIAQLRSSIDTLVQTDPHFLFTYTQYQNSLTTATGTGMGSAPVYGLMDARATFLSTNASLAAAPPVISNVVAVPAVPAYLDPVTISASVSNATSGNVYLGYRDVKSDRFTRIQMYDDGMHGDSAAGDNIYGASLYASSLKIHFYIYAENASAGAFSPERAEHEFFSLNPSIAMAGGSDIVLNEVMASNQSIITNEECKFKDWIEVYNTTGQTLGLGDLYLSDDPSLLLKWGFPRSSLIQPGEHLLIWADDLDDLHLDLHTNFNLGSAGDAVYLSDSLGNILDSISFGTQTADISLGRCPDGFGPFTVSTTPSPRQANASCSSGMDDMLFTSFRLYPNPATDRIRIVSDKSIRSVSVCDLAGKQVVEARSFNADEAELELSSLAAGLYSVSVNGSRPAKLVVSR
ncbi:MAG: hypothetical protein RL213_1003 [Bacteroidota bacterium]